MPDARELVPGARRAPQPPLREAVVNEDASEAGQAVKCVEPGHAVTLTTDPLAWMPYVTDAGVFFPKHGDRAIVATPKGGPPFISAWWPKATSPDVSF